MKILQLCKKFPWPLKDGESVAVNALSRGLADQGVTMDLLAMNTNKHFTAVDSEVIESMPQYRTVKWVPVDTDLSVFQALRSLLEGSSYHLKRFIDPEFTKTLKGMLHSSGERYDFIILESLYMVPYVKTIEKYCDSKIIFRSHNLEFEIWDRLASNTWNPVLSWYLRKLARKLKDFEFKSIRDIAYLLPISPVDMQKYSQLDYKGKMHNLPLGIDLQKYPVRIQDQGSPVSVGFIGSLDWRPNVEGLEWFLNKVWPVVTARYPNQFVLHIAGRNMPDKIRKQSTENVVVHGEIPHAIEFIQKQNYFIVPLFSGSGMRVKILEAMALGKMVLSTQVGIEGIPASSDKEFIRADTEKEFLRAFDRIAAREYNIHIIGRNARSFIEDNYSIQQVSQGFYKYLHEILRTSPQNVE